MNATEIATSITTAWASHLTARRRSPEPHPYVYASAYRACDRRLVYEMTDADKMPAFDADTLAKFRRGEDRERDLLSDLVRVGRDAEPPFAIIGQQQRFELKDRKGRPAIVGKVDARLQVDGAQAPLEVKAWSPQIIQRVERFADLFDGPWTRSGAYQLLAYLYGAGEPYGFMLIDRAGLPLLLPVELEPHLDRLEEFLTRAEQALDHRDAGTLPEFPSDGAECKRCPFFGAVCNPPTGAVGAQILLDPDLEAALERREALKAAAAEFDTLDRQVKAQLRGVELGIAGNFQIAGKWGKSSRVELPADVKKQYTVIDPKGRFTLEITRLGEAPVAA